MINPNFLQQEIPDQTGKIRIRNYASELVEFTFLLADLPSRTASLIASKKFRN
jgi:hypothetical protein